MPDTSDSMKNMDDQTDTLDNDNNTDRDTQDQMRQSFIKEVWYGQRSLAETYWLWGFLVNGILLGYGGTFLVITIGKSIESWFPYYLYIALTLPYCIWLWVGLWRAATVSKGFWGGLVKVLTVIAVPYTVFSLFVLEETLRQFSRMF